MAVIDRSDLIERLHKIPWFRDEEGDALISLRDIIKQINLMPEIEAVPAPEPARVLTLEEVKEAKICWIEDRNIEYLYPAVYYARGNERFAVFCVPDVSEDIEHISEYSEEYAQFEDKERWLEEDEINKWWRPWSQKPTEEQMEAQEWND